MTLNITPDRIHGNLLRQHKEKMCYGDKHKATLQMKTDKLAVCTSVLVSSNNAWASLANREYLKMPRDEVLFCSRKLDRQLVFITSSFEMGNVL